MAGGKSTRKNSCVRGTCSQRLGAGYNAEVGPRAEGSDSHLVTSLGVTSNMKGKRAALAESLNLQDLRPSGGKP